tara:strand:- start:60 stop:584 length:525 start_codon:yes stop_codon:yes gene_type:complete
MKVLEIETMANPFGIEASSTVPSGTATYDVTLHSVPEPHPAFKEYSGIWKPENGLVSITGKSETFRKDPSASEARRIYAEVKHELTQLYGQPFEDEEISDEDWPEDLGFCSAIENGARSHTCDWDLGTHDLTDNVQNIMLTIVSDDGDEKSQVWLEYGFPECKDEVTTGKGKAS